VIPSSDRPALSGVGFGLCAILQIAGLVVALFFVDRTRQPIAFTLSLAVASLPWFFLTYRVYGFGHRIPLRWILALGLLLRILAQLSTPALSTDLYRYAWEGRLQLEGKNPYLYAPDDPEVRKPGDPLWEKVQHKEVPAAYPPVTQLYLRFIASFGGGRLSFRLGFALMDVALMFLMAAWLARIAGDPTLCLVYAMCPLVVVEFGSEGHNDSLALMLLVASLTVLAVKPGDSPSRSPGIRAWTQMSVVGVLFGLSISAKLLPLLLVPWLLRRDWRFLPACIVTIVLAYLPFAIGVEHLSRLFGGLSEYANRWRSNDSFFILLYELTGVVQGWLRALGVDAWWVSPDQQRWAAKIPLYGVLAIGALIVYVVDKDPNRVPVALLALLFVVAPVVHPWYVCWVVPFLAVVPSPALFALIAGVPLSYHTLVGWNTEHVWNEIGSYKLVEYTPFYAFLALAAWNWVYKGVTGKKATRRD